jgi:hypothetical protein
MRKDITIPEVKKVSVVIKPEQQGEHWSVHLVNDNEKALTNILVVSSGYIKKEEIDEKTSTLRHFLDDLQAHSSKQVELIDPKVFHLYNEFEITYYLDEQLYFKKFVFYPDSIHLKNLNHNDILGTGVVVHS